MDTTERGLCQQERAKFWSHFRSGHLLKISPFSWCPSRSQRNLILFWCGLCRPTWSSSKLSSTTTHFNYSFLEPGGGVAGSISIAERAFHWVQRSAQGLEQPVLLRVSAQERLISPLPECPGQNGINSVNFILLVFICFLRQLRWFSSLDYWSLKENPSIF